MRGYVEGSLKDCEIEKIQLPSIESKKTKTFGGTKKLSQWLTRVLAMLVIEAEQPGRAIDKPRDPKWKVETVCLRGLLSLASKSLAFDM